MGKSAKRRIPTIHDVAERAGVAPITVSRVVNNTGYISEDTRARVQEAIDALHYVPNTLSRSLRSKRTDTIALIVSDITNPFWTTVTRGVEDAASEHGLNVILCNSDERADKLENYVRVLLQKQTDGFLLVPTDDNIQVVQAIEKQHVPLVILDRLLKGVTADTVRGDSEQGAYGLVRYLIGLGHRHITMLSGPLNASTTAQRIAGYQRAMRESGLQQYENVLLGAQYRQEAGYKAALTLMQSTKDRPTALFANNNMVASGVVQALETLGLRVPRDVSVASFDDLPIGFSPRPFMTVATQAPYNIGYRAAQQLIDTLHERIKPAGRDIVLPVEIIIRDSCAPLE